MSVALAVMFTTSPVIKLAPFVGAVIAQVGAGLAETVIVIVAVVTPP